MLGLDHKNFTVALVFAGDSAANPGRAACVSTIGDVIRVTYPVKGVCWVWWVG